MGPLDFNRVRRRTTADSATEPRRIFTTLPAKDQRYAYARDVQSEVWEAWHARRNESDLVVKMNTGGGKTVVGLMMLKSCLNEEVGPAVYITPDIYLAEQVLAEAKRLGLEAADQPEDPRFLSGRAILITNVYKLFNGRSVFGVKGGSRPVVEIGTLLIDDAHACLATVQQQFALRIPSEHAGYNALIDLFRDELRAQSAAKLADLGARDPAALMPVPFWAWADQHDAVLRVLHPHRTEPEIGFHWPLIADDLRFCRVAVSATGIEIAPPCVPVDQIPSFVRTKRRLYLTATLADDSILVTHFGAAADSIRSPVTPRTADDLGDRMILTPQETFPATGDEQIRGFLVDAAQTHNVVVIVPSRRRAEFWSEVAHAIHGADTLNAGLAALRSGHVGLVVLVNKYDGIDLPGDACRILVLDGLPEAHGELARLEAGQLETSDAILTRQIQRIEQGMGRGIRSNDDFCVVLLLGARLAGRLHPPSARARFSPATHAQLTLADDVAEQLSQQSFDDLGAVVAQCLQRDPGWVAASRDAVVGLTYPTEVPISPVAVAEREAFELAERGRFTDASKCLEAILGDVEDVSLRGLLKQHAAAYLHFADKVAAQRLQVSAVSDNRALLRPREGIAYVPLRQVSEQAKAAAEFLGERYATGADLVIGVEALLSALVPSPQPEAVPAFEQGMADLGVHLGFGAQRPERDIKNGPDVLWLLGDLRFLVIECKSGATTDAISRRDIAQLSHSIDWFHETYDRSCTATPVIIHPSRELGVAATARSGTRVIVFDRLGELREAIRAFGTAVAANRAYADPKAVAERLSAEHLNARAFIGHWGQATRPSRA